MTSLVIGGRRLLGHSLGDAGIVGRRGLRLRALDYDWPQTGGLLQQVLRYPMLVGQLGHLDEQVRLTVRSLGCGERLKLGPGRLVIDARHARS